MDVRQRMHEWMQSESGGPSDGSHASGPGERRYEVNDANVKYLMLSGAGIFGIILIGLFLSWGIYELSRALAVRPGALPLTFTTTGVLPPRPRLQSDPHADLMKLRAAEDSVLLTYGWVNKDSGLVRIPIDRAMELLVKRGLPVRQGAEVKR